jgi:tRNA-Thr(GGU) m(6)t(6)A37 methyltransferase TsaA
LPEIEDPGGNELSILTCRPIGIIHTPFTDTSGMPIQPSRGRGVRGEVEVFPDFVEGLVDLEGFSHIVLLFHLHRSRGYELRVTPFLDTVSRGLFATRAPRRPNPIGLSVVRLVAVDDGVLTIEDLDILDGSPLLDIKPYIPDFDREDEIRLGWLDGVRNRDVVSDDRFRG